MSVQMVLLPVFVLVGLTFALWLVVRSRAVAGKEGSSQVGSDQFELPCCSTS